MNDHENDSKSDNNPSDIRHDAEKWIWCQRCQRCYQEGEFRLVKGIKLCPYNDCMGLIDYDGLPWSRIQRMHSQNCPKTPKRDTVYLSRGE